MTFKPDNLTPEPRPTQPGFRHVRPVPAGAEEGTHAAGINPFASPDDRKLERRANVGAELYDEVMRLQPEKALGRLIGKGGEHLVFDVPDNEHPEGVRDVVVKVNARDALRRFIDEFEDLERKPEDRAAVSPESALRQRSEDVLELKKHFGRKAVPAQKILLREVPVSRQAAKLFFDKEKLPNVRFPEKVTALVTVQARVEMPKPGDVELRGYYPEAPQRWDKHSDGSIARRHYIEAHDILTGRSEQAAERSEHVRSKAEALIPILDIYPDLKEIARIIDQDPEALLAVRDFVEHAVDYTNETRKALDLAGNGNMFLAKGPAGWKLHMPDALSPDRGATIDALREASVLLARRERLGPEQSNRALNVLNTVRVINALALLTDAPVRVELEELKQVEPTAWLQEFRQTQFPTILPPKPDSPPADEATVNVLKKPRV